MPSLVGSEMCIRDRIEAVERSGARVVLSTQLNAACDNCSGVSRYLGDGADQVEANRRIAHWLEDCVRRLAREGARTLVEVCGRVPCDEQTLGDAIHPTAAGYRWIVRQWAAAIEALVPSQEGDRQESGA